MEWYVSIGDRSAADVKGATITSKLSFFQNKSSKPAGCTTRWAKFVKTHC